MLALAFASAPALASGPAQAPHKPLPTKPNVVFILADDAGFGDLSSYGAEKFETPHLDRLAEQGMRFTDAHSPSSVCTPSRYSLLTGRYSWRSWLRFGTLESNDPLLIDEDRLTVADAFKESGYTTGIVGKWHLGFGREGEPNFDSHAGIDYNGEIKPGPLELGFDYYFGMPMVGQLPHIFIRNHRVEGIEKLDEPIVFLGDSKNPGEPLTWWERHRKPVGRGQWFEWGNTEPISYEHEDLGVRITGEAVDYIERQSPDQPFFLYFAHRSPHVPWEAHPRFEGSTDFETEAGQIYGQMMVELDWSVGEIMEALERQGLAEDTIVIFSSDNGGALYYYPVDYPDREGHFANGSFRGQKTQVYEGGHRIPFIVRWPGVVEPGTTSEALIANTDFFATVAELLDFEIPAGQAPDSISFLDVLTGPHPDESDRETLIVDSNQGLLAIRHGPWVYIPAQGGGGFQWRPYLIDQQAPPAQLFHLGDDPAQRNNLFWERPDKARELSAMLAEETAERDSIEDLIPKE
ncbi:MAG: sulfatase family protein [Opitutales bacterium]